MAKLKPTDTILRVTVARSSMLKMTKGSSLIKQLASQAAFEARVKAALRAGAVPVLSALRASAMSLPSKGTRSPMSGYRNLRARIANSLEIETTGGVDPSVFVVSKASKMGDAAYLPARTNEGRWRHPVMGNKNVWVTQTSRQGWFDGTARKEGLDHVEKSLLGVLSYLKAKWIFR